MDKQIQFLKPFPKFCCSIGYIPTSYKVSLTYEEQLMWLCHFLETEVIPTVNKNGKAVEELQRLFELLHKYVEDYFDNLDVQEEINNKLDDMVEDGTLENIINDYLANLTPSLKPNTNLNLNMGMTSFLRNADMESIQQQINNVCKNYFSSLKQQVRLTFNESIMDFELTENDNIENQIIAINQYITEGGNFKGLHFYIPGTTLLQLFETYSSYTIMQKYLQAIYSFIDTLPYKNSINRLWILNEAGQNVLSDTYKSDIIAIIEDLQSNGYEVSIPMAYAEQFGEVSTDILNALDFYSINLYPQNDVYKEFSSIEDVKQRFNIEYRILEPFISNKELVVSEFGCSSSWRSFSTPSQYYEDQNGKPISLFIEGFFKSQFMGRISSCFLWYYMDAFRYAPNTLLSIKENTEVRYG